MRRLVVVLALAMLAFNAKSQESASSADSIPTDIQKQGLIYSLAKRYNDPDVAKMALYNVIAFNPQNLAIRDSLALLYFEDRKYASAAIVSQDILAVNGNDPLATEIAALSFENLGLKAKAITYYEKLYLQNNDIGTLYKTAFLQYEVKRYNEANTSIDIVIESQEADEIKFYFPKSQTENQEVTLRVASYRVKALIAKEQGNTDQAKEYFNKALEIIPDFQVVIDEMKTLE
ncbi:MAG: hypothetical protein KI790_01065 [Cyclobacteriaceae bacterium]|nr:hypothetical protein [Cyclobacteriaceae bacterium HetDA_MAG_MS6]